MYTQYIASSTPLSTDEASSFSTAPHAYRCSWCHHDGARDLANPSLLFPSPLTLDALRYLQTIRRILPESPGRSLAVYQYLPRSCECSRHQALPPPSFNPPIHDPRALLMILRQTNAGKQDTQPCNICQLALPICCHQLDIAGGHGMDTSSLRLYQPILASASQKREARTRRGSNRRSPPLPRGASTEGAPKQPIWQRPLLHPRLLQLPHLGGTRTMHSHTLVLRIRPGPRPLAPLASLL